MADFTWHAALAARPAVSPLLLLGSARHWNAGEVVVELSVVRERLTGSRVLGVLADNGPAWVIADLACQDAGVVHLPLPAFFHAAQLRHALEQSGADTVLTDQPERIGALDLGFAITGRWQGLSWMRRVVARADHADDGADAVEALPADTAKISFTSGSTGAPKGVCLSAAGLIDTARAVHDRLADLPLGSHLAVLPLALLLENVAGLYAPLLRGVPVHVPPLAELGWTGMHGFDPAAFDRKLRDSAAASVILVPELLKAWSLFLLKTSRRAPDSLTFAAVGGARVAPALLAAARRAGIPAYQGYGLTEGGSVLAINRPGDDGDGVGRPLAHAQLVVAGEELKVRTRAFVGYIGQPSLAGTAFPTGDLATFDVAGHLHLAGRRTNLLISSFGRNISPEWLEAVLLAQPQIMQAVVVGDSLPAPLAIVVPMAGVDAAALDAAIARANAALPDYARIAHYLASPPFTAHNGLATGNGRPQRAAIVDHHRAALMALHPHPHTEPSHVVL